MTLPSLSEVLVTNAGCYYKFPGERLLFVNVESDFERIVPLLEAAIAYSSTNEVCLLDISRVHLTNFAEKLNIAIYDFFRGGNLLKSSLPILREFGINVIKINPLKFSQDSLGLSTEEQYSLKLAIRNENLNELVNTDLTTTAYKDKSSFLASIIQNLTHLITTNEFDRVFVWNGRFVLSTSVALASYRANCKVTKVEWGSKIDKSLEIFREPPRARFDTWQRVNEFRERVESGIQKVVTVTNLTEFLSSWRINRWTSNFVKSFEISEIRQIPFENFVTFFTSSFYELPTYGSNVWEINLEEITAVNRLIRVAAQRKLGVVVRVHPNPWTPNYENYESNLWINFLADQSENNVVVLAGSSPVDSYQLAHASKAIFTVNSTIGFECLAEGIPTFFFADSEWESKFDSNRTIDDDRDLCSFLDTPYLIDVEKFRYYLMYRVCYGFNFKHFEKDITGQIYFNKKRLIKQKSDLGSTFIVLSSLKRMILKFITQIKRLS